MQLSLLRSGVCLLRIGCVVGLGWIATAGAADIDLNTAIKRTLDHNPELQTFVFKHQQLEGERLNARLRPPLAVGVEIENLAGSDEFKSVDAAETTIALSSVIELGGQRDSRLAAVNAREQKLLMEQQALALALVAETTRRYIDLLAAQSEQRIATDAQTLAQTTLQAVQRRVREGASPRADALRAQAALARTQLAIADTDNQQSKALNQLALLWGRNNIDFDWVVGDLLQLTPPVASTNFAERLQNNPQVRLLADNIRLQQAELSLAQSRDNPNLHWRVGVRQFQQANAAALVAGIDIPLFSGGRNRGNHLIAEANLNSARQQQDNNLRELQTRLLNLSNDYATHFNQAAVLREQIIPALEQALADADLAYQRGLYSYLELVAANQDLIDAQHKLIDTAADALRLQADIEQLIAEPLSLSTPPNIDPATRPEVNQ